MFISGVGAGGLTLQGNSVALSNLVFMLAQQVGRIVINKTELSEGLYDFKMQWTPDAALGQTPFGPAPPGAEPSRPAADPGGPSLFTALQEQLGLRLVPSKGPVDVFIIDGAQKPQD